MHAPYDTLESILETDLPIRVRCTKCAAVKEFTRSEIKRLAARMGYDYSLVDRRCKCRLTPECDGWNRFDYLMIVWRPMITDRGVVNEIERDERRRRLANVVFMNRGKPKR